MVPLLFLLLSGAPTGSSMPDRNIILRDVRPLSMVTDKDMRPSKPPDCKTAEEVQRAVQEVRNGEAGECFVRDATAFNPR